MFATANPAAAAISKTSARLILEAPAVLDSIAIPEDVIFEIIALLTNPVNEHFDSVPGKEIAVRRAASSCDDPNRSVNSSRLSNRW